MALGRSVARTVAAAAVVWLAVVLWRAATVPSRQPRSHATGDARQAAVVRALADETDAVTARLAEAVRIPFVSYEEPGRTDHTAALALHALLRRHFPKVHAALEVETVATYSLLYRWKGRRADLAPALITAHLDVVPVDNSTAHLWTHDPFGGAIADGHVWGRGTLDDKFAVWAILEAVERLLAGKFQPDRTVYIGVGHDEEIGGYQGARKIAELLRARNVQLAFVLDEGVPIVDDDLVPGFRLPMAAPGLSEKGHVNVLLRYRYHRTATGPGRVMLDYLTPELPFLARILFANIWCFRWLLEVLLWHDVSLRPFFWTTQAVTVVQAEGWRGPGRGRQGGIKSNIVPQTASATVNFRIAPWDSTQTVLRHVEQVVAADPLLATNVHVSAPGEDVLEPSPISSPDSFGFHVLSEALHDAFSDTADPALPAWLPNLVIAPSVMVGNTDTRHYWDLTDCIMRFSPAVLRRADIARLHGVNERISVQSYLNSIVFFHRIFVRVQEPSAAGGHGVEHTDL